MFPAYLDSTLFLISLHVIMLIKLNLIYLSKFNSFVQKEKIKHLTNGRSGVFHVQKKHPP